MYISLKYNSAIHPSSFTGNNQDSPTLSFNSRLHDLVCLGYVKTEYKGNDF